MASIPVPYQNETEKGVLQMPSYEYPSHARVKLAAVKQDVLANPAMPTMRMIDRDNFLQKLPDEHCRTSTICTAVDFNNYGSQTIFGKGERASGINCMSAPGVGEAVQGQFFSQPRQFRPFNYNDFSTFLNTTKCCAPQRLPPLLSSAPADRVRDANVTGYAPQVLSPDRRHSWRFTLKGAHEIDDRGRKPFPADMLKQYRDTHSKTGVCMAPLNWRA